MRRRAWWLVAVLLLSPGCPDSGAAGDAGIDREPAVDAAADRGATDGVGPDGAAGAHAKQVDALVGPIMAGKWAVGLVVGLVSAQGTEVHSYGVIRQGGSARPDRDTLFEIGSITKTFTSLLLAQQVAAGRVALDQPVQQLLPTAKVTVPASGSKQITLRQLSTHTSGLPNMPTNVTPGDPGQPLADYDADKLYAFLNGYTLGRDPGTKWLYSNVGVGLLGHALTLRSGRAYETMVTQDITTPLKLPDTAITLSSAHKGRLATGYTGDLREAAPIDIGVLAPAGELRSTTRDMLAYLSAQIGLTKTPLGPSMATTHNTQFKGTRQMGLGWIIHQGRYHWHNGGTTGFATFVGFDTKARVGVVVLSNTSTVYHPPTPLGMALLQMMTQQSYAPVKLPATVEVPSATLDLYAGTYSGASLTIKVVRKGDALWASWQANPSGSRLYARSSEAFYLRTAQVGITFHKDGTGAYSSMTFATTAGKLTLTRVP